MAESADRRTASIAIQNSLAPRFEAQYQELVEDPYTSTFAYGRRKVDGLLRRELDRLPRQSRLLDVGCGTGFHIAEVRRLGFDAVGVEPGPELRTRARANNPDARIEDGQIEDLPFPDASFDVVMAIEVIRHLAVPAAGVRELARVLRPGGLALVTAAPRWSLNGYAAINAVTSRVQVPTFTKARQSFVSVRDAKRLFSGAGFASTEVHGVMLGPWQIVERISRRLLARLLRAFEPVDDRLSDRPLIRGLTNQILVVAHR